MLERSSPDSSNGEFTPSLRAIVSGFSGAQPG
jgi:hypothetical protein